MTEFYGTPLLVPAHLPPRGWHGGPGHWQSRSHDRPRQFRRKAHGIGGRFHWLKDRQPLPMVLRCNSIKFVVAIRGGLGCCSFVALRFGRRNVCSTVALGGKADMPVPRPAEAELSFPGLAIA